MKKKATTLVLLALGSLLTACNPFVSELDTGGSIDELCLQEGFTPCRPPSQGTLQD